MASARLAVPGSNRTQLTIGAVAVVLIAVIVIVGLVLNKKQNAAPVTDHPLSTNSTATLSDGIITVTGSGTAPLTLDLFEDGICPACGAFEAQFGQQVLKAVDENKLAVRYHFLNFLDALSPTKTYSTRVAAAFQCVAAVPGAQAPKGLFLNFHTTMFSSAVQPAENGSADLSNAQLAALAVKAGAPPSAAACISAGTNTSAAGTAASTGSALLAKVIGPNWATPTVFDNGAPANINTQDWLTKLLA